MSKPTRRIRNLFMILVTALGIGGFAFLLPSALRIAYAEGGAAALQAESPDRAADGQLTVLAFSSDVHSQSDKVAATRTGAWLRLMADENHYGHVDAMAFGGDLGSASAGSASNFYTYAGNVIDAVDGTGVPGVFTTGNHEFNPGDGSLKSNGTSISSNANPEVASRYVLNAVGREGDNYIIYCLGSEGWSSSYANQVSSLTDFLGDVGSDRPIFIITHFPLHYAENRSTTSAGDIIDVLNNAAATGKKIVYIWGHNHTNAPNDTYYDEVFTPGYSLQYGSGSSSKKTIQFYYAAAGCMSDSEYGSGWGGGSTGSKYVLGKGLVVTINSKDQLSFAYYTENGTKVADEHSTGGQSTFTDQDPVAIDSVSISESSSSPTVEVGKRITLHTAVTPADATVKTKTWTSSDTSVATVDTNGIVKGVSQGTATITVTISDGITRNTVSASVEVAVTPRTSSGPVYVYTETFSPDKNYIIANKEDGTAYALTNNNGSIGVTQVTVEDGVISLDDEIEEIVFTTSGSGSSVTDFQNGNYYLRASGSSYNNVSLSLSTTAHNLDWTYTGNRLSTHRASGTSTTYYLYYNASSSTYSCSNTESSSSSPRDIYLFEEVQEQVPVTSVTVTPATATIEAGRSTSLTATVEPANATIRNVTWSSSDTSVATVDDTGHVRGVAVGTATITATATDGSGKSGSCTVTVEPRSTTEQYYVIMINDYALSSNASSEMMSNSSGYEYHGLQAVEYNTSDPAPHDILWTIEEVDGVENGYLIRSYNGELLSATYVSNENGGSTGRLITGDIEDIWIVNGGLANWQGDGSTLQTSNASSSSKSLYLGVTTSNNSVPFFTVRSTSDSSVPRTSVLVEPGLILDPVAVTGITLNPTSLEIETGKSAQITANVLPENADDKTVTWTSADETVATVDNNGRVRGVAQGTTTITATTNDGGFTATCTVTVTPSSAPGIGYIIVIGDYAMSCETSSDTLINAGSGSQQYEYHGLTGVPYDGTGTASEDILWLIEPAESGYYIKSQDGRYLNATYGANSTGGNTGVLKVDDTPDIWTFEGSLEDWVLSGSTLTSANSGKSITHEEGSTSAPLNLFTVRSTGESSQMIDPDNTDAEQRFVEVSALSTGKDYIIAVTASGNSVYAVENVGGSSSADTGSATLDVVPASGTDAAYIVTSNAGVVWNYNSSNYLVNNSRYLSRSQNSPYVPRASGSGSAVSYSSSNKRLTMSYGSSSWGGSTTTYYLTNSSGTFGLNTSSSSAAQVRLFEKQTVFNFKYVVQFVSNGVNYQSSKYAAGEVPVYSAATPTRAETELYTYTFSGWSSDGGTTVIGPNEALPAVSGPVTYVAQFTAVPKAQGYTVTFVDGEEELSAQTVEEGGKATKPEEDPSKEGCFAFDNWYADAELTTLFDFDMPITADTTVYAKWNVAHAWGEPAYVWSEGNASVTATRVCANDEAHVETETVAATSEITAPASCTEDGVRTWTSASFANAAFVAQTTTEAVPALGHDYVAVVTAPTCTAAGYTTYTCSRCGDSYTADEVPALGHDFGEWAVTAEPTCTEGGTETRTCSRCGAAETREVAALGHDWEFVGFTWTGSDAEGYTAAAANYACKRDESHAQSVAATLTNTSTDATCTDAGTVVYTASVASAISLDGEQHVENKTVSGTALGHNWGPVTYAWSDDNATVTATRTCLRDSTHVETETVAATAQTTEPTCTEAGSAVYTSAAFENAAFEVQAKSVAIPALGHDLVHHDARAATCTEPGWGAYDTCSRCDYTTYAEIPATGHDFGEPAYVWAEDNASVTATRVCANDGSHVETETVAATGVTTPATCTEPGGTVYTSAAFENAAFEAQSKTVEIPALGHDFGEWSVTTPATCTEAGVETRTCSRCDAAETREVAVLGHDWEFVGFTWTGSDAEGYTAAAANYACKRDESHAQSVAATLTNTSTDATCTDAGTVVYTASVASTISLDEAQHVENKTVSGAALGHNWGPVTYAWSEDNATVTAARTCLRDSTHVETETVAATSQATPATCTEAGSTVYTSAAFENAAFEVQTKSVAIPVLGHDLVHHDAKAATCTEAGNIEYWACSHCGKTFSDEAGATEIADVSSAALGHDWEFTGFTWTGNDADGYTAAVANYTCKNDGTHIEVVAATIAQTSTDATCTEAGTVKYTATVSAETSLDNAEHEGAKTVAGAALGHSYGEPTYTWAEDNSTVTASRACTRCDHVETETAEAAATATPATCTEAGYTIYTAEFENGAFVDQTKRVEGDPAAGHSYGEPTYEWAEDFSACTATAECTKCASGTDGHTVTEVGAVASSVTKEPTCTAEGETTYTATFENALFTTRTKTAPIAKVAHTPVADAAVDPTCTAAGLTEGSHCSVCGAVLAAQEEVPVLGHDFGDWAVTTPATCTTAGVETRTCTRCGAAETRAIAALGHDLVHHDAKTPTCTEAGWEAYDTCSRCDYTTYVEIPASGHMPVVDAAVAPTCTAAGLTEGSHCSVCGAVLAAQEEVPALGHDFGEWVVTLEPTCTAAGSRTRSCSRCDAVETEAIEALGHDLVHHDAKAATCTEAGWDAYDTCSRCDYTTYAEIPASGHSYGAPSYEWAEDNSTVTATRICANDESHIETETAEATGAATTPTCTEAGYTIYTAEFENVAFAAQTKRVEGDQALGHSFGDWVATIPATCTATGVEARTCSRCGETETRTIPATGHTPADAVQENVVAATCTEAGSYDEVVYCSVCGAEIGRETVETPALGHAWDDGVVTTEPGCETEGVKTFTCSRCQATYTEAVAATGHTWGEGVVTTEPGCETEGVRTFTCSVCGKTKTEAIDPLGHDWNSPTYTWNKDEDGNYTGVTATRTCKRDATHIETETADIDESKTVVVEPTETEEGSITYTCKEFENPAFKSRDLIVVIPATGHELDYDNIEWAWTGNDEDGYSAAKATVKCVHFDEDGYKIEVDATVTSETTAATCAEAGKTVYTATVSFEGEAYTDSKTVVIPALGHTSADAVRENVVAATCAAAGSYDEVVYCSVCGAEIGRETVEIPALGHDYVAVVTPPTCTAAGYTTYTCSRCGDTYTADEVPALGHTPADAVKENVVAATCTAAGSYDEVVYCSVCGAEIGRETVEIPALGHDYVAVVTAPTCTAAGYTTYTCSRCGDSYTADEVPALGHDFGDPTYVWTADNSSVTATRTCSACGFEETETVAVASTVDDDGNTILTADFENPAFETQTKVIEADKIDISPADVTAEKMPMSLFSESAEPTPKVVLDGVELELGKDFEVVGYGNNKYPGAATITVRGIGDYTGEATGAFIVDEPFCDVMPGTGGTPHYEDIMWVYGEGIAKGWNSYPNCEYRGMNNVVRQDMAAFLFRLAVKMGVVDESWQPTDAQKRAFTDVNSSTPHAREIWWLASSGISTGWVMQDGSCQFRPGNQILRQDMAAFLFRLAKLAHLVDDSWQPSGNPFDDVSTSTPHYREVLWLAESGVSTGWTESDGTVTFRPSNKIVRQDMAAFLHRLGELKQG